MISKVVKSIIVVCCEYIVGYIAAFLSIFGIAAFFKKIWPDI